MKDPFPQDLDIDTKSSVPVVEDSGIPSDGVNESDGPLNGQLDKDLDSGNFVYLLLYLY